jgi:hypothetical protein
VGRQRGASAAGIAVAATRAGEHQLVGSGAGGKLARDDLVDSLAHWDHADAGRALWFGLENYSSHLIVRLTLLELFVKPFNGLVPLELFRPDVMRLVNDEGSQPG